jgi:hypothetical protein
MIVPAGTSAHTGGYTLLCRVSLVKILISLGFAALLAAALSTSAVSAERKASVVLLDESPIAVFGRGFVPRERVTVRVVIGKRNLTARVRASTAGRFTVRFQESLPDCSPFSVTATGGAGSRAMLRKINIPPPCGMDPQPGAPPTAP